MSDSQAPERPEVDPDDPGELHTEADDEPTMSHAEAAVAGMLPGMVVYGDTSLDPNADDKRDSERADEDEHF